jgi:hypothetical protein
MALSNLYELKDRFGERQLKVSTFPFNQLSILLPPLAGSKTDPKNQIFLKIRYFSSRNKGSTFNTEKGSNFDADQQYGTPTGSISNLKIIFSCKHRPL